MSGASFTDAAVRQAAFAFLDNARDVMGEVLPYRTLSQEFVFQGHRVPLLGPQGIFKPAVMTLPLSIATAPEVRGKPRPYEDKLGPDGTLSYRYRGTDPQHRDNVGLRECWKRSEPLIYLHGIVKGWYLPFYPVFILADQPERLSFLVEVNDQRSLQALPGAAGAEMTEPLERRYAITAAKRRLHQEPFKFRVLRAYREHCAVCRLRHRELLEAAHIIPDSEGGPAHEPNGLALCKLHHAAFDADILGIRPDLIVEIREDILREVDGPMLNHGLQEFDGKHLLEVPRSKGLRPSPEFLDYRYQQFKKAG